jgi:putative DNA primase/helicase
VTDVIEFPESRVPPLTPNEERLAGVRIIPPPTDPMGVARAFVEDVYDDDRSCRLLHHRGLFYAWEGTHWSEGEARGVRASLYKWLEFCAYLKETKADASEPLPFQPTRQKVANVIEALGAITHVSEHVDPPAWVAGSAPFIASEAVALQNGLLHLPTRELHLHTPQFFNEHVLPFAFDPQASCTERWHRFLDELWDDDAESISVLQELMGYILAGGTSQQKIFMLVGPKRTGKGTILRVLTALLGSENVSAPTLSSLAMNFGLQPLVGKPLAAISDARLGSRSDALVAVERLLSISGEDAITVDRKYRDPWTGRLPTRFLVLTNEIPRFTDASGALASRFVILTLTRSFYGREDTTLTEKLLEEAPGIFNWCLDGLDRLLERGHFIQPAVSRNALQHLEDLASPVGAFVRDRCVPDVEGLVDKDELWKAWREWCNDEGAHPGTKAVFVRDLRAAVPGATPRRLGSDNESRHVIAGVSLRSDPTMQNTPDTPDVDSGETPTSGTSGVNSTEGPTGVVNGHLGHEEREAVRLEVDRARREQIKADDAALRERGRQLFADDEGAIKP